MQCIIVDKNGLYLVKFLTTCSKNVTFNPKTMLFELGKTFSQSGETLMKLKSIRFRLQYVCMSPKPIRQFNYNVFPMYYLFRVAAWSGATGDHYYSE